MWFAVGLVDRQQHLDRGRVGPVRVVGRDRPALDPGVAVGVGVVDEEAAVLGVVRVEGQAEQPLLAAPRLTRSLMSRNGSAADLAVPDDPDRADLLDDEEPAAAVVRVDDLDRPLEPLDHQLQSDRERRRVEGRLPPARPRDRREPAGSGQQHAAISRSSDRQTAARRETTETSWTGNSSGSAAQNLARGRSNTVTDDGVSRSAAGASASCRRRAIHCRESAAPTPATRPGHP